MARRWTTDEDHYVLLNYNKLPLSRISAEINRTIPAIRNRAGFLGVRPKKAPPWTPEEEEFLRKNWRKMSISKIAKKLGRTWNAIEVKAGPGRLNLGPQTDPGKWTAQMIANLLNIDVHAVLRWIKKKYIKAGLAPVEQRKIYQITTRELLRFLRNNPGRWDSRKCPYLYFDIIEHVDGTGFISKTGRKRRIAGKKKKHPDRIIPEELKANFMKFVTSVAEEKTSKKGKKEAAEEKIINDIAWLKEKIAADQNTAERRFEKWTPEEDLRLARLFKRGNMTYAEMGEILGRSAVAVGHRLTRINVWEILERELIVI